MGAGAGEPADAAGERETEDKEEEEEEELSKLSINNKFYYKSDVNDDIYEHISNTDGTEEIGDYVGKLKQVNGKLIIL